MPRRIWIIDPDADVTDAVLAAAEAASCPEIMRGVAPALGLPADTRGAVEVPDPVDPPAPAPTLAELAAQAASIETIADMEAFRAALAQSGGV